MGEGEGGISPEIYKLGEVAGWNKRGRWWACLSFRLKLGHIWSQTMPLLDILIMSMSEINIREVWNKNVLGGFFFKN